MSFSIGALIRACSIVLVTAALSGLAGCGDIHGHEEFSKMVMNRAEADVSKSIGKPAAVDSTNPARVVWTYNNVTYDIENQNKRDARTLVVFAPGTDGTLKVAEVKYEN
jgi:hypothetical protein